MTIDETIAHEREVAEIQRKDNDNCEYKAEYGCKGCAYYYSKPCIECAEESEQIAEWLEELKAIKDGCIPIIHGKAELELHDKAIRTKAIDDFIHECDKYCGFYSGKNKNITREDILKIAEQLKAGGTE